MFEIIIKQKRTVTKKQGKEWRVVSQQLMSEDDVDKETRWTVKAPNYVEELFKSGKITKDVYGYTPEIDKEVEEEREILKQTVEELDLAAVIKAINKI